MNLKRLIGSGDKIGLLALPFIVVGLLVNFLRPDWFSVGGPPLGLRIPSVMILPVGVVVWLWSVVLILQKVPKHELITSGPYAWVKHPLYTGVAWLVLPWLGFLLDSWLGVVIGGALYLGSRLFSPEEERELARTFGPRWEDYCRRVKAPWV